MNEQIQTMEAGCRKVVDLFTRKGFMKDIVPVNNNRYMILLTTKGNVMVAFKRELFHTFGKMFKGESGEGETINMEDLSNATGKHRVRNLYFVYSDGSIYSISVEDFLTYSHKRVNYEGKVTRSISIKHLRREV